jgi:hypothetical protein
LPNDTINFQHDPLTCAIALGWNEGIEIRDVPLRLEVNRGYLHERIDDGGVLARIVTRIDASKFNEHWLHIVVRQ